MPRPIDHPLVLVGLMMSMLAQSASAGHPSLFIQADELPGIRERARTTHARYLAAARLVLQRDREAKPALPNAPDNWDNWPIEPWAARMINASVLAAVGQDPGEAEQVVAWLTGLCTIRADCRNNYTYGFYALALATGYDLLYARLSDEQRATVRKHLADVCRGLAKGCTETGWWRNLPLHHDCLIPSCGLGVAALALKGEDDRWRPWYDLARRQIETTLSMLDQDGGWPEGVSCWTYLMSAMLPFLEAARNVAGDDFYARSAWLKATARGRVHLALPTAGYVSYGDGYLDGGYGGMGSADCWELRLLARRYRDRHVQWLANRRERTAYGRPAPSATTRPKLMHDGEGGRAARYAAGWDLLWFDADLPADPPDSLPTHYAFDNLGYVVARSGWGPDAAVLSFRAGPVTGRLAAEACRGRPPAEVDRITESAEHGHQDQNALTFYADGVYWAGPPGYGARASARHTTLLINGREQSLELARRRAGGSLVAREFADDYVYLAGEASQAYPPEAGVRRFRRHVLWLKPDVLLVCDEVAVEKPCPVEWRIHFEKDVPIEVAGQILAQRAADGGAQRTWRFLLPEGVRAIAPTTRLIEQERTQRKTLHQLERMRYAGVSADVPPGGGLVFLVASVPAGVTVRRVGSPAVPAVQVVWPDGRRRSVAFVPDASAGPDAPVDLRLPAEFAEAKGRPALVVGLPPHAKVRLDRNAEGEVRITSDPAGRACSPGGVLAVE